VKLNVTPHSTSFQPRASRINPVTNELHKKRITTVTHGELGTSNFYTTPTQLFIQGIMRFHAAYKCHIRFLAHTSHSVNRTKCHQEQHGQLRRVFTRACKRLRLQCSEHTIHNTCALLHTDYIAKHRSF
jgi:RecA-family ATPase